MGSFSVVQAVKQIPKKKSVFIWGSAHIMSVEKYASNAVQSCLCSNVVSYVPVSYPYYSKDLTTPDPDAPVLEIAVCDMKKGIETFIKIFSEVFPKYGWDEVLLEKAKIYLQKIGNKYKYFTYDERDMYAIGDSNDTPEKFSTELRQIMKDFSIANYGLTKKFETGYSYHGDSIEASLERIEFMIDDKQKREYGWKTEQKVWLNNYLTRIQRI
jgi:hypothetical protein